MNLRHLLPPLTLALLLACGCSDSTGGSSSGGTSSGSSAGSTASSTSSGSGSGSSSGATSGSSAAASTGSSGSAASSTGSTGSGSTTGSGSSTSSSGSTGDVCGGGALPANTCTPHAAACHGDTNACLAVADNTGLSTFGLRVAGVRPHQPTALSAGLVANALTGAILPNNVPCNVAGGATANVILKIDQAQQQLTVGEARPIALSSTAASSDGPFGFETTTIAGTGGVNFQVAPATSALTANGSCGFSSAPVDLALPLYLDPNATSAVVLPLRALTVTGTLNSANSCIGALDVAGLDPSNSCVAAQNQFFAPAGTFAGFIGLEDADAAAIGPLQESLCVLLSGNAATYGDGASPVAHCKRDSNGAILLQGDSCLATSAPATPSCADAMALDFEYAASAVALQ